MEDRISPERLVLGTQVVSSVIAVAALKSFKKLTHKDIVKKCTSEMPDKILGEYLLISSFFTEQERIEIISAVLSDIKEKIQEVKTKYANRLEGVEVV